MKNLLDILEWSQKYLTKYGFSKARLESEQLISHVLSIDRILIYAEYDRALSENEKLNIKKYILKMINKKKRFNEILQEEKTLNASKNLKYNNKNSIIEKKQREIFLALLNKSIIYLKKYKVKESKLIAEHVFSHVLNISRLKMSLTFNRDITSIETRQIRSILVKIGREQQPLDYVLGFKLFYGYKFIVNRSVLIPRWETELLVEKCIDLISGLETAEILDIGCGSGAISIVLGKKIPNSIVLGVDISLEALEISKKNKEVISASNVEFIQSDIFKNIKNRKFNLIVSNPPYISEKEYIQLDEKLLLNEPKIAFLAGDNGLCFYKNISKEAGQYLYNNGYLAFEVGYNQGDIVKEIMIKHRFINVKICYDYAGHQRMVFGMKNY